MSKNKMKILFRFLFFLIFFSAFLPAGTGDKEKIHASDIGTKYEIIGPLGYRLGKLIDIKANALSNPNKGKSNWLSVITVDGKKLEKPIQISYEFSTFSKDTKELLVGKTYTLRGYQHGKMVGIPYQAMKETTFVQTSNYHFDVALVIIRVTPFVKSQENTETKYHTTFKGMELHSWHEAEAGWCFSLLQGSNYRRTIKEITDPSTRIVGVKNLKESLARLPVGGHVFWVNYAKEPVSSAMLDDLLKYAQQIPVKLQFLDASHIPNDKNRKLAKELGDALIKATISGTLDKSSSIKEIAIGKTLKSKLLSMRDMFDHSCYTKVLSGDAPSVGDGKASFHFFLICHEEAKIGIRLRFDKVKERFHILGFWTSGLCLGYYRKVKNRLAFLICISNINNNNPSVPS